MTSRLEQALRAARLKVTAGRIAVLNALESAPHSDAERIFRVVSEHLPTTSIQSVHNILADLTAAGLTRRIEPAGSPALYERRVGDNHHHIVCTRCGAVADVDCVVGESPCLTPSNTAGYQVNTAEVTYWGLCPGCQAAESGSTPAAPSEEAAPAASPHPTIKENHVHPI